LPFKRDNCAFNAPFWVRLCKATKERHALTGKEMFQKNEFLLKASRETYNLYFKRLRIEMICIVDGVKNEFLSLQPLTFFMKTTMIQTDNPNVFG
jgi:hypothetical protein